MDKKSDVDVPPPIPDKLMDIIVAFRTSKALFAACELGLFDVLHDSVTPTSAKAISEKMSCNLDGTTRLLDTLAGLGLLEKSKQGSLYSNTKMADQFLTKSSPDSVVGYLAHSNQVLYPLFGNLESAVREGSNQWMKTFGQSADDLFKALYHNEEDHLSFLRTMHSTSRHPCHAIVRSLDLSEFNSCCDLGGATGAMAYTICQCYPDMKITVCELPSVLDSAHVFKPAPEECPNQANVTFVAGDFFKPDLPKADLYVMCRILHDWSEEKVDLILANVFSCLPSGGGLLICEKILNDDKQGPISALLFSLNMLVATKGKERSFAEYKQLLQKHGFVNVEAKQTFYVGCYFMQKGLG